MKMIQSFDPGATASGTFDPLVSNACGRIYLFNESPIGLQLTFEDGSVAGLPPFYFRSYKIAKPGPVKWTMLYSLNISGSLSTVLGEAYESAEAKDVRFTEGPLSRQTNIGNSIPLSTSTTSVANDGNAAGTLFVESTVLGDGSSATKLTNDAQLTLGNSSRQGQITLVDGAGSCMLQSDVAGNLKTNNGVTIGTALTVNTSVNVLGSTNLDNNTIATNGAGQLSLLGGLRLVNSGITWKTADTISGTHTFTGTTTGTYTHGAGGTPFIVIAMTDVSGSQSMGYDTITSTQVHITSASGLGFKALTILG